MPEFQIIPGPPDPNEEELQVGPVEAESSADVLARLYARDLVPTPEIEEQEEPAEHSDRTFTLKEMLLAITGLSVWLAVLRLLRLLSWPLAAGVTGLVTFFALLYFSDQSERWPHGRLAWWVLFATYVLVTLLALLSG